MQLKFIIPQAPKNQLIPKIRNSETMVTDLHCTFSKKKKLIVIDVFTSGLLRFIFLHFFLFFLRRVLFFFLRVDTSGTSLPMLFKVLEMC